MGFVVRTGTSTQICLHVFCPVSRLWLCFSTVRRKQWRWFQLLNCLLPRTYEYVTRGGTQMAKKFDLNFIMIQSSSETVKY